MKLLRCDFGDGVPRPAAEREGSIVDLTQTNLVDTITEQAAFEAVLTELAANGVGCLEAAVVDAAESTSRSQSAVTIVEPVTSSGRFFALGGVYTQHLRERGQSLSRVPSQWIVPDTAIVGPDEPIVIPEQVRESVMPAVELCVVIGKRGRYISEHDAMNHVAGYTISNDLTARTDWPGPMGYKLMDTFSPCGPSITPADQVDDVTSLEMTLHHGDECICSGSTISMRFSLPFLISFLSSIIELRPGDIISTGDPGRVEGVIVPGNTIRASIETIGELENPVTARQ